MEINCHDLVSSSFVRSPGDPHFSVQNTVDKKPKVAGSGYFWPFFYFTKSFMALVFFVINVHNLLAGSPVVVLISNFLFDFRICKIKLINFVNKVKVCSNWSSCLSSFAREIFWFNILNEILRWSNFIGRFLVRCWSHVDCLVVL